MLYNVCRILAANVFTYLEQHFYFSVRIRCYKLSLSLSASI